jgi:hypothetical protein
VRDHASAAGDADLRGRDADPGDDTLPAATASAADDVPRRNHGPGRRGVSGSSAAAAPAPAAIHETGRRTRLIFTE